MCKFPECFSDADGADISGGVSSRSMFVESNQVGLAKDVSKPGGNSSLMYLLISTKCEV